MSFFEDLIGSFAEAGAKGLNDISARNQREAEMKLQNDLAIERAKAAESIRLDLEEKQRQAKMQRLSEQRQEVEAAAPAATQARELSQAKKMAPSVDGNVLDVIKSRLTPAQMQKYYGVDQSPVATLDDKLGVARDKGLYDAEAVLQNERKETVAAIAAARKDALEQARLAQGDNKLDTMLAIAAGHDATRIATKAAGSSDRTEKLDQQKARERRIDVQNQKASVVAQFKEGLIKKADAEARIARLEKLENKYQAIEDAAEAGEPAPKPGPAPKPAAAPAANTPGWSIIKKK